MELKMFVSSDSMTVEKNVNDWLEENKVVVHHIGQSQSERNGKFVFTLSVFYESIPSSQKNKMAIAWPLWGGMAGKGITKEKLKLWTVVNATELENLTRYNITSDHDVIQSILNGEITLFELLIRRYNSLLYKISRSYGFNHQDAQDLMQDTHVAAYENLKQFEGRATYKTWISKIMIHKCLYRLKHGYGKYEVPEDQKLISDNKPLHMNSDIQPDEYAANKELGFVLEKSLENLPVLYRNVFVLRELEGFSTKETADLLNISEVNVKVRLNRARTLLQQEIRKIYNQSEVYSFNLVYCDAIVKRVFDKIQNPV